MCSNVFVHFSPFIGNDILNEGDKEILKINYTWSQYKKSAKSLIKTVFIFL